MFAAGAAARFPSYGGVPAHSRFVGKVYVWTMEVGPGKGEISMGFNGANGSDKVVEVTWAPYRAFVEGTVAAQEPYMRLARGLLASQAEVGRFAARVLVEQAEQQREAYRLLVKESSRAYKVSPRVPASGGRGSPASRETELPIEEDLPARCRGG